jgi:hypothetical protein
MKTKNGKTMNNKNKKQIRLNEHDQAALTRGFAFAQKYYPAVEPSVSFVLRLALHRAFPLEEDRLLCPHCSTELETDNNTPGIWRCPTCAPKESK